jgi:hypothetical protein
MDETGTPEPPPDGGGPRRDLWAVSLTRQRRSWALFTAAVGLSLLGLCALAYSQTALVLGAVLLGVGLLAALLTGSGPGSQT